MACQRVFGHLYRNRLKRLNAILQIHDPHDRHFGFRRKRLLGFSADGAACAVEHFNANKSDSALFIMFFIVQIDDHFLGQEQQRSSYKPNSHNHRQETAKLFLVGRILLLGCLSQDSYILKPLQKKIRPGGKWVLFGPKAKSVAALIKKVGTNGGTRFF